MNGTGQQIMFTAISMKLKNYSGRKNLCKAIGCILSTIQMVLVYEPVQPVDGQYLGYPVFDGGSVVLLVVNFTESAIHILRFLHQQEKTQEVVRLPLSAVKDCYDLILHTSPLSLTRQPNDGTFEIIWPEQIRFAISSRETLNFPTEKHAAAGQIRRMNGTSVITMRNGAFRCMMTGSFLRC